MKTKTLTLMSNYGALWFALLILQQIPGFAVPTLIIGYSVSAIFLHVLGMGKWIKVQLLMEVTKIPVYYRLIIDAHNQIVSTLNFAKSVVIAQLLPKIQNMSHPEAEQYMYFIDSRLTELSIYSPTLSVLGPLLGVLVKYSVIGVIYFVLKRGRFFSRIIM